MKKKLLALIISLMMLLCAAPFGAFAGGFAASEAADCGLQEEVCGSAILHCFDWSYNSIREALPDIAAAGYTAVQTSPVQAPKDYDAAWTNTSGQWWKLYQPLGLSIADGNTWLGTRDELSSLCSEAESYGIKVIVDIVANHLANNGASGGTYANLNENVEEDLNDPAYFHTEPDEIDYNSSNRYNITQRHMGMPDLNTGNGHVQERVLGLLKDCVDCGVDGFRFDAAKHIELPGDPGCGSAFWPAIVNGITEYADENGRDLFMYGEILGGAGENTPITDYTCYIAVTDNQTGNNALSFAANKNANGLANCYYIEQTDPAACVIWAESHDTYLHNESSWASDDLIVSTWAIVGARADSTALFLARPNENMGEASADTTWKSKAVSEINKFKNHFDGTGEYLSDHGYTTYIERGTNGVVISKLDGAGSVALPAKRMTDGVYTDQITGNTFVVSNGVIRGTVGDTGVAVVYDPEDAAEVFEGTITAPTLYFYPSEEWKIADPRFAMYLFNGTGGEAWVSMEDAGNGFYSASVPEGNWTGVIFCRMRPDSSVNGWGYKWNQTADLFPVGSMDCFTMTLSSTIWDGDTGSWSVYGNKTVYAVNNAGWCDVRIYYWTGGANNGWPGAQMTPLTRDGVYTYEIPCNVEGVIFTDGGNNQTANITTGAAEGESWVIGESNTTEYHFIYNYTVGFDANGGSGDMADQSMVFGTEQTLLANTFTRPGYEFTGWNTKADGTGTGYDDGALVCDLAPADGAPVRLYAEWAIVGTPGDVDGSGEVDTFDALLILRHALGLIELSADKLPLADVSGDGRVETFDALLVLRFALGLISEM